MIRQRLFQVFKGIVMILFFGTMFLKFMYKTKMEGLVELPNAPGFATITREEDT